MTSPTYHYYNEGKYVVTWSRSERSRYLSIEMREVTGSCPYSPPSVMSCLIMSYLSNEGRTRDSVRGDVWRCGARWSSAYHVVAKILKCFIFFKVSRLVTTTLWSTHAWHWVSHTSWTVRALCVIDGTTCHDMAQTMRYLAVLTDFVPLKWHDLARHIAWHCIAETKFVLVCGLLKSPNTTAFLMMRPNWTLKHPSLTN